MNYPKVIGTYYKTIGWISAAKMIVGIPANVSSRYGAFRKRA